MQTGKLRVSVNPLVSQTYPQTHQTLSPADPSSTVSLTAMPSSLSPLVPPQLGSSSKLVSLLQAQAARRIYITPLL